MLATLMACAGATPGAARVPSTSSPSEATPPGLAVTPAPEVDAAPKTDLETLMGEVSAIRGLAPKRRVQVRYLEGDAFERQYSQSVPVDDAVRKRIFSTWVAFGFVSGGAAPAQGEGNKTAFSGFYDGADDTVYMRKETDRPEARGLLVHELVHALQDQHFGIRRFTSVFDNDDALLARKAVMEGDATLVSEVWGARRNGEAPTTAVLTASQRAKRMREEDILRYLGADDHITERPDIAWRPLVFAYYTGMAFLSELAPPYDFRAIDRLFATPPNTSREILHADVFMQRSRASSDAVVEVPALPQLDPRAGTQVSVGSLGEYRLRLFLQRCGTREAAELLSNRWLGDRYALFERAEGQLTLAWHSRWPTEGAAWAFADALKRVAKCYPEARGVRSGVRVGAEDAIERRGQDVWYVRGHREAAQWVKQLSLSPS
jgi:hypothetical protein